MKKMNKKGFTLIELLAVIIILAVIALIAVPIITNIINKSRKAAAVDSAYAVLDAGKLYYTSTLLDDPNEPFGGATFDFDPDNENEAEDLVEVSALNIKGTKPDAGVIKVSVDGTVTIDTELTFGNYTCDFQENSTEIIECN